MGLVGSGNSLQCCSCGCVSYQWEQNRLQQLCIKPKLGHMNTCVCAWMPSGISDTGPCLSGKRVVGIHTPLGICLEQRGTLETSLTLSHQSQSDVFSTGERKNRCMLVFVLFVRRILCMVSKVLRFLYIVLPFSSFAQHAGMRGAVSTSNWKCTRVVFIRLSDLLAPVCWSARAKCTMLSRLFLWICKSC